MASNKKKAERLFAYIEEVLDTKRNSELKVQDLVVDSYGWFTANLLEYDMGVDVMTKQSIANAQDNSGGDEHDQELPPSPSWFSVERQVIKNQPQNPPILNGWIMDRDNPFERPEYKETKEATVQFNDSEERKSALSDFISKVEAREKNRETKTVLDTPEVLQGWIYRDEEADQATDRIKKRTEKTESVSFSGDESRVSAFQEYVDTWEAWKKNMLPRKKVNDLYDTFFALHRKMENEGDNLQIKWGHNLLTWGSDEGQVCMPTHVTTLELHFYPEKQKIELSPDPMEGSQIDLSFLFDVVPELRDEFLQIQDSQTDDAIDVWNAEAMRETGKHIINRLSSDAEIKFSQKPFADPPIKENPRFYNSPIIYVREQSDQYRVEFARKIRESVGQSDDDLVPFVKDLVEDAEEDSKEKDAADEGRSDSVSDGELYFPLPYNKEQRSIADQLEGSYGAVVQGPPGTGKSQTIANIIARSLAKGESVLVTAEKGKPLEVLRDKLPQPLQSLVVPLIGSSARKDQVFKQSVQKILEYYGHRNTGFSSEKIESLENKLNIARKEKASLISKIEAWKKLDSEESIKIEGDTYKPEEAAKKVNNDKKKHAWFPDDINPQTERTFTVRDVQTLVDEVRKIEESDLELHEISLPEKANLPTPETFREYVNDLNHQEELFARWQEFIDWENRINKDQITPERSEAIQKDANNLHDFLQRIEGGWQMSVLEKVRQRGGNQDYYENAAQKLTEQHDKLDELENELLGKGVEITGEIKNPQQKLTEMGEMEDYFTESGITLFSGVFRKHKITDAFEPFRVSNQRVKDQSAYSLVIKKLKLLVAKEDLKNLWGDILNHLPNDTIQEVHDWSPEQSHKNMRDLETILNFKDEFEKVRWFIRHSTEFSNDSIAEPSSVQKVIDLIESLKAGVEIDKMKKRFRRWKNELSAHDDMPFVVKMIDSLKSNDAETWDKLYSQYEEKLEKKPIAEKVHEKRVKVAESAPKLARQVVQSTLKNGDYELPSDLHTAWVFSQLEAWIQNLHSRKSIHTLREELDQADNKISRLEQKLISKKAWHNLLNNVTTKERQALEAWRQAMEKYGKGTGKYADKHMQDARAALKDARAAVPVWIMSLSRVMQMFDDPQPGMFDLVIFDEASQCDVKGVLASYLGSQMLVVGDPQQVSPSGTFVNQEDNQKLVSQYLHDIPYQEGFSSGRSFYDIAAMRIKNNITLKEHFRCVPEIIGFSNHLSYGGSIQPLREQPPETQLKPALNPIYVENGYVNENNKVNEPEAEAVVDKIVELINDERYDKSPRDPNRKCSFGVVTLLGHDQAAEINKRIHRRIPNKEIEDRNIECGSPYTFQGDERDVMMLSMVKSLDQDDPEKAIRALTTKRYKRRFNVAASRASDQAFLFHSIPRDRFSDNDEDVRRRLVEWFYDPQTEELEAGREALQRVYENDDRMSKFAYEVGNLIINKGYKVIPEYEVIGYSIDLVVEGENARLAVECDGDQYHGIDQIDEDTYRENKLRRAGWDFWRLSGSEFYHKGEDALDSLWEKLDDMDINPRVNTTQEQELYPE